jgi:hypothetical protein
MDFGFSSLNEIFNTGNVNQSSTIPTDIYIPVRVVSIVLNEEHPRFKELGEWNGLGTIEFQLVTNPINSTNYPTAIPLSSNTKKFPLVNEIVYLLSLPNTDIGNITSNSTLYYIDVVSLWNHPHHNAFPSNPNLLPPSQQKDYIETQVGNVRRVTDQSTEIFLGNTFKERSNIHPLLPFEGDIMYEGRWGNSIRLGSTVQNTPNNWSSSGEDGDPLIIIRNGQGQQTEEGWIPIVENINNDESSIYLTSNQTIPLTPSSANYLSYKNNPPTNPSQYTNKQIVLNSGRLIFNSSEDHILFSSNKSINLNAVEGVNVDTPTVTLQTNKIFLGSKNAVEPLLLGNQTVILLNQLIGNLSQFAQVCSTLVSTPAGTPIAPLNVVSSQLIISLNALQANLENIKSKYNYTV